MNRAARPVINKNYSTSTQKFELYSLLNSFKYRSPALTLQNQYRVLQVILT